MSFKNLFDIFSSPQFQSRLGLICTMVSVMVAMAVVTQVSRPSLMISPRWISKIEIHNQPHFNRVDSNLSSFGQQTNSQFQGDPQDHIELELQFLGAQIDRVSRVLEGFRKIQRPSKLTIDRHNQELFSVVPTEIEIGSKFLQDNRAIRRAMILNWITQSMSAEVFRIPVLTAILADYFEMVISGADENVASLRGHGGESQRQFWMDRLSTWDVLCKEKKLAYEERFWCRANHGQAVSPFSLQSYFTDRLYEKYLAQPILSRSQFLLDQLANIEERVTSTQFANVSGDFTGFSDFVKKMENILELPVPEPMDVRALVFGEQNGSGGIGHVRVFAVGSDFMVRSQNFQLAVDELLEIKTEKFVWQSCQAPILSEVNQVPVRFTKLLWIKVCKPESSPRVDAYISSSIADFAKANPQVEFFEMNWSLLNDYNKVTGGHAAGLLNALGKRSWTSLPLFDQRIAGLESATLDPHSRMYHLKAPLEIISAFRLTPQ